ncbi:MAG TPA: hypothetical protein VGD87_12020, partial [Archangium sp.]
MAKLESLIVDLQVNTAQLQKGLDQANKQLASFSQNLAELAGVVVFVKFAEMAAEAVSSLVNFVLAGAEAADAMGKMAQVSGVTVESFSRLAYAGELSGVSAESLSGAMVKLDKAMVDASKGADKPAAAFAALGIKVTDASGKVRASDEVFKELADRFASMEDGATKTALATELLGKTGAELIPMMNGGSEGLAKLADESDRLGVTIRDSAAASAEAFNDNLAKLQKAFTAVGQRAAADLTPALTKLTDELLNSKEGAAALKVAGEVLAGALRVLASGGVIIAAVFEAVGKTVARVASAVANVVAGRFSEAWDDLKGQFTDIGDASLTAGSRLETIWGDSADAAEVSAKRQRKAAEDVIASLKKVARAQKEHALAVAGIGHSGGAGAR